MAGSKPLPGQKLLSFVAPPAPTDRQAAVREIVRKVLSMHKRGQTLPEVLLSTAWVGIKPAVDQPELRDVLHFMVGDGTLNRTRGETHMWVYLLRTEGPGAHG